MPSTASSSSSASRRLALEALEGGSPATGSSHRQPSRRPRRDRSRTVTSLASTASTSRASTSMAVTDWAKSFWITLLDEDGETFYANPTTGERKWQLPPGTLVLPRSADGEWYELWSDEHNLPYYFHTLTNETRWYKPTDGFVIPLKAVQRFSKGKRFSLMSIDTPITPPAAPSTEPAADLASSDSFEMLAKRSLELDEGELSRDPLSLAVLQLMTASTARTMRALPTSPGSSKPEGRRGREDSRKASDAERRQRSSSGKGKSTRRSKGDRHASEEADMSSSTLATDTSFPAMVKLPQRDMSDLSLGDVASRTFADDSAITAVPFSSSSGLSDDSATTGPTRTVAWRHVRPSLSGQLALDVLASQGGSSGPHQADYPPSTSPVTSPRSTSGMPAALQSDTTVSSARSWATASSAPSSPLDTPHLSHVDSTSASATFASTVWADSSHDDYTDLAYGGLAVLDAHEEAQKDTHGAGCSPKAGGMGPGTAVSAAARFVAPLRIRKRKSKIGLGEAFEPVTPVLAAAALPPAQDGSSQTQPTAMGQHIPGTPSTCLSPSAHLKTSSPIAAGMKRFSDFFTGSVPIAHEGLVSVPSTSEVPAQARPSASISPVAVSTASNRTDSAPPLGSPGAATGWRSMTFGKRSVSVSALETVSVAELPPNPAQRAASSTAISKPHLSSPAEVPCSSGMVQSASGGISPMPIPTQSESQTFTLASYAEQHFALTKKRKTTLFRKTSSIREVLKWQAGDLEAPFLDLPKSERWDALQCFTHLQHVMGDRVRADSVVRVSLEDVNSPSPWDNSTTFEAQRILSIGINSASPLSASTAIARSTMSPPASPRLATTATNEDDATLRDEIYVQLLCQLTDNPSAVSVYRGWQLLQVLLATFPPSPLLEPTLRAFLVDKKRAAPQSRLGIIARYALMQLDQRIVKGPRGKTPSLFEVRAASEGAFQPSVFGETLHRIMSLQSEAYPDAKIPIILPFLADGIMALGGLRTPGIFRTAGDSERVTEFKICIDQGRYSFTGFEDPHIAASLFKLWLRELLQPLIPLQWYDECMDSAEDATRVIAIIQRLPSLNRRIIAFVINFLQIFTQDAVMRHTMITASSLAMIFTPTLFRPAPAATLGFASSSISTVFQHARIEQKFVLQLLEHLDATQLADEDDWFPSHGRSASLASSTTASAKSDTVSNPLSSSTSSRASESESSRGSLPDKEAASSTDSDVSRESIDSDVSGTGRAVSPLDSASIASSKRRRKPAPSSPCRSERSRTRTTAAEPGKSKSLVVRSRAISDSGCLPDAGEPAAEAIPAVPSFRLIIEEYPS